jgi:AcrR family transcriptional regulator
MVVNMPTPRRPGPHAGEKEAPAPKRTRRANGPTGAGAKPALTPKPAYHHGDLARALVLSATALVEQGGPGALTLREAARRAGVSVAAPYRHFADRAALLAAVLAEGFDGLAEHTERARRAAPDALAALRAVGVAYVDFAAAHPSVYRLMFGPDCDKPAYPDLMAAGERALAVLVRSVRDAQAAGRVQAGPAEPVALAGWSLCHGLASLHVDGLLTATLPMPVHDAAEQLVDMLVRGVATREGTPSRQRRVSR